ncbi:ATP-grasp fold amidoligase family protein [Brachybacterium tyrofermentans]|uniref:ATP-grasp fold amidoligase family protein n=1 Tax=Brachybacterium tyrofermentans TaxID=47848 RepID=UPI003FD461E5
MMTWHDRMVARLSGDEDLIPWFLHDKIECYDWSRAHGFPTPEIYERFNSPESIAINPGRDSFVLKPTRFSSTTGVMVLSKSKDKYFDAMSKREYSVEEIIATQKVLHENRPLKLNQWIIEELVVDAGNNPVPLDIKAYAFRGDIALFLIIDRNVRPTRVDWYDGNFRPLAPGRMTLNPKYVQPGSGVPPENSIELAEVASEVSRTVGSPFARIDLYASTRGPLLGEVTLTPGGLYYGDHYKMSEEQNALMGALWQSAEADSEVIRNSVAQLLYGKGLAELSPKELRSVQKIFWSPYLVRSIIQ